MTPKKEGGTKPAQKKTLYFERKLTTTTRSVYDLFEWERRDAVLTNKDGVEVFRQNQVEVPKQWSDRALRIVAEKYFRVVNGKRETSVRQVVQRVVSTIVAAGIDQGLLDVPEAAIFQDELTFLLLSQSMAFNSPVWFNIGVPGVKQQASACFIQDVNDTMQSITELAQKEIMLFKGGSGTGSNLSKLRSSYEKLSGGGWASGPVSFMKPLDSGAGVTKSGGTTRRAAKMATLNVSHPDILETRDGNPGFIRCKSHAEQVAHDLYSTGKYSAEWNVPGNVYDLVGFQNANNSVRVTDEFMNAVQTGDTFSTKAVTTGEIVSSYPAKKIFSEMAKAAWLCGDPGIQYDTTINKWHTCKTSGRINGSNPCSEYMFLDDTACNLASLNLMNFVDGKKFEIDKFEYAVRVTITAMEILVGYASYPSKEIADNSVKFRPLGIGYANLGALMMVLGAAYGDKRSLELTSAVTSLMSAAAYHQSALMASVVGPFSAYRANSASMLEVIRTHERAAHTCVEFGIGEFEEINRRGWDLWTASTCLAETFGYRNSQISVIAPTGTIGFMMDCDTTGIEPMLGILVYKKIVGGGYLIMPNRLLSTALKNLGYSAKAITEIEEYVKSKETLKGAPGLKPEHYRVFAGALDELDPITWREHLDVMAAAQPFLSGAISKTVNLPNDTTPEEIEEIYMEGWRLGLKAVAVYRDGCKLSQPASTKAATPAVETPPALLWGDRKKLPKTRQAITHKFSVGGQEGYITIGKYEDGKPAEVFLEIANVGSTMHGILDMSAKAISLGLQHGVPLKTLIDKYKDMQFEPRGFTDDENIRTASSLADYLAKFLELAFYQDLVQEVVELKQEQIEKRSLSKDRNGPPCSKCGALTQRGGTCWVCVNCATTTGCG